MLHLFLFVFLSFGRWGVEKKLLTNVFGITFGCTFAENIITMTTEEKKKKRRNTLLTYRFGAGTDMEQLKKKLDKVARKKGFNSANDLITSTILELIN